MPQDNISNNSYLCTSAIKCHTLKRRTHHSLLKPRSLHTQINHQSIYCTIRKQCSTTWLN